jgi:hypothetical protein
MTEFEYHIYQKQDVLYHSLSEEDFQVRWNRLQGKEGVSYIRMLANEYSGGNLGGGGSTTDEPSY